jgi:hypothetical protein
MNRIHEEKQVVPVVLPQSMASGATITGTYKSIEGGMHDVLFNVVCGALAATKKVTVKVYQADDIGATGEAEIVDAASVFTAPGGGATKVQIQISIPLAQLTKSFATVKVTNDAAGPVLGYAEMILDARERNKDANSQADVVTVL